MDRSILDCPSLADVEVREIGREREPLIKVDDFMVGAKILKDFAVAHNNFSSADNYYPGVRMPIPIAYTVALAKHLRCHINEYFGFDPRQAKKAVSTYSIVTTAPCDLQLLQRIPHFDAANKTSIAAIHYLFNGPGCGTAMYRHRKTGFEYVDEDRYTHYMNAVKSQFRSSDDYPEGYINGSTNQFELIERIDAKFNRLIMYRGRSLHSGCIGENYDFDPSPSSGRLTITTFLEFSS